ncbi:MAG: hypothetical protein CGU29_03965 [Candidatus Dactylopiibacterium carminicum]|uniref:Uncharacterized protein n=1 Tax=Candidatus Dactylopiibacterium carminicum TaxID=857335 RepID=A0A272EWJ1_9RHOO|nr:hypothetical protein [Candidatus Dactylopiibacterium carminicum]KAF7599946.1 hypothetical protein BGI27_04975 [Candidatus Dactylopiibacterium carminicum]PAS94473.1 MAG: hypothetical protein CGU29_03965 [Candidatus Dactylopiibacterium carminicum]PAS99949.1 MAG: hypothetical protein BSR46_05010 [Candidatus Dactylopiibacterium carminicum]
MSGSQIEQGRLQAKLNDFSTAWQQRLQATGGGLDATARYAEGGSAQQRFSLRGIDAASVQLARSETVQFSLGTRTSAPVVLEAGQSEQSTVRTLDQALAPLGIRATRSDRGELGFQTAESNWNAVKSGIQVRGEGRLFPTGRFSALRAEASATTVQPERWSVADAEGVQQTLTQAVRLGDSLTRARRAAEANLDQLAATDETVIGIDQAQILTDDFT